MPLPTITVSAVVSARLRGRVIASGLVTAVERVQAQTLVDFQPAEALFADVGGRI